MGPDPPEVVEEILLCRVDVLCRRTIDPDRRGRGPDTALTVAVPRPSLLDASIGSTWRIPPIILL
jgi:hypothetical protein